MQVVHAFEVYDLVADAWKAQPLKSSAERIAKIGGRIIAGTEQSVEDHDLDAEGRFVPRGEASDQSKERPL